MTLKSAISAPKIVSFIRGRIKDKGSARQNEKNNGKS